MNNQKMSLKLDFFKFGKFLIVEDIFMCLLNVVIATKIRLQKIKSKEISSSDKSYIGCFDKHHFPRIKSKDTGAIQLKVNICSLHNRYWRF